MHASESCDGFRLRKGEANEDAEIVECIAYMIKAACREMLAIYDF